MLNWSTLRGVLESLKTNGAPFLTALTKMFWKYNTTSSSQIETILAKEDVTLQAIMDEEDILNECKVQNKMLLDFLIKPEILTELVTLTTTEPGEDIDERNRFKYPNVACELLTCDIPSLNERLAGDEALLAKLYAFLDREPPLNPLLASFFSKIMSVLIAKKAEQNWISYQFTCLQVLDFLKAKDNFVTLLLNHLGTSAIMDLTLKLMTQVEGVDIRQNILNYLDSQKIIQKLVGLLNSKVDSSRHHNVAQLLCDFLQLARDNQRNSSERNDPDPLLNTLESPETVNFLLDNIFGEEKSETAIVGGIQVLLELIDKTSIPKYDFPNNYTNVSSDDEIDVMTTMTCIIKRLKDFHNLLIDPPKKEPLMMTVGLCPPLGNTRLQVTRLISVVISCGGAEAAQELVSLGTLAVLLDLFFAFPWNNFLHTQVQACVLAVLTSPRPPDQGDNIALPKHLLVNCKLIERILQAWSNNDEIVSQTKGVRQGYMGHLINIANIIVDVCADGSLEIMLKDNSPEEVEAFIKFKDTTLAETNTVHKSLLGGVHPHTSNDDTDEYGVVPFPQSGHGQQNFNEYQMQQMAPEFYDTYGYIDDDFKGSDEVLQRMEIRSDMNFDLSEGDLVEQHELFKQVCAQNINTLELDDADDQIFEDKEHTFQTVIEKETDRNSSSDSEEDNFVMEARKCLERASRVKKYWSNPEKDGDAVNSTDPWGTSGNAAEDNSGWADFSSAVFEPSFATNAQDVRPIEADLKVENIEIDDDKLQFPQQEQMIVDTKKDSIVEEIAQSDKALESQVESKSEQEQMISTGTEVNAANIENATEPPAETRQSEPNKEGV